MREGGRGGGGGQCMCPPDNVTISDDFIAVLLVYCVASNC